MKPITAERIKKSTLTVYVTSVVVKALHADADRQRRPLSWVVQEILERGMKSGKS